MCRPGGTFVTACVSGEGASRAIAEERPSRSDADDGRAIRRPRPHQIRSRLRHGAWRSRMVDPGHQIDERFHGLACWRHSGPNHRSTSAVPSGRAGIAMNNAVCISLSVTRVTAPIGRRAASRFLQPDGPKKVPCSRSRSRKGCSRSAATSPILRPETSHLRQWEIPLARTPSCRAETGCRNSLNEGWWASRYFSCCAERFTQAAG